jgi:hypothetical protein
MITLIRGHRELRRGQLQSPKTGPLLKAGPGPATTVFADPMPLPPPSSPDQREARKFLLGLDLFGV